MLTGVRDWSQGGLPHEDRPLRGRAGRQGPKTPRARLKRALVPTMLDETSYERVAVYSPHAVNWMLTVAVRAPRTTTAINFPESNRGAVVQAAL